MEQKQSETGKIIGKVLQKIEENQRESEPPRARNTVMAVLMVLAGIIVSAFAFQMLRVAGAGQRSTVYILFIAGGALILEGARRFAFSLVLNRTVTCPFCGQKIAVSGPAELKCCPSCFRHLIVRGGRQIRLAPFSCRVCGEQYGIDEKTAKFICRACGSTVVPGAIHAAPHDTCPACGGAAQADAYFCESCGKLLKRPVLYDVFYDLETGEKAVSLLKDEFFAAVPPSMCEAAIALNTPAGYFAQAAFMAGEMRDRLNRFLLKGRKMNVPSFVMLISLAGRMLVNMRNILLLDPQSADAVHELFDAMDVMVGRALRLLIDFGTGQYFDITGGNILWVVDNTEQIQALYTKVSRLRNGLYSRFTSRPYKGNASLAGLWAEPLVSIARRPGAVNAVYRDSPDWAETVRGGWYEAAAELDIQNAPLPGIRVPPEMLAHGRREVAPAGQSTAL